MERPRGIQFLYLFTGTDIGRLFLLRFCSWLYKMLVPVLTMIGTRSSLRWNPVNLNNCLYIKQVFRLHQLGFSASCFIC
ncbi:hypothetical protein L1987_51170 [Smallanthus sonchifolius]|uniref:Uncharacterized protein n=1 Tax=Smallanthus sonchifolius TaxID=185202 RepID=A0ACB9EPX1_9ASTR|nr:hypothetical protein L1987_51170 [Smallanthus sonchifolius]